MTGLRAVYFFDRTIAARTPDEFRASAARAAGAGLTALVTKHTALTPEVVAICRDAGLRAVGSIPCFSDHAAPRPDAPRPIGPDGIPWAPMEWYTGVVPTDPAYTAGVVARCAEAARQDLDGLVLDFLRWPLHWELELRPGATPRRASYDPVTLRAFEEFAGVRLPTEGAAGHIDRHLAEEWTRFRCAVVTGIAARIAAAVRDVRPGLPLGAFLVPAPEERRRALAGQSAADLGTHLDLLFVMSYHAILHADPGLGARLAADAARHTSVPVVPMVQTTADPALARGADWGPPMTPDDFAAALTAAGSDFCLFPGEGIDDPRWSVLAHPTSQETP
ncbi:hypothetical protein EDD29_2664 [Actinocorallia herbida]|uniref:Uncharacterized protein n=1 Tax=Actinocorallia herbida TaxID=58109 RepID=A0A3N1CV13_9ACTN|nr:hypothetical protein [Actinocorallia herbida]ROO85126.1 hypothetical protein EDD29_2664 [Actinocorallia herbida]